MAIHWNATLTGEQCKQEAKLGALFTPRSVWVVEDADYSKNVLIVHDKQLDTDTPFLGLRFTLRDIDLKAFDTDLHAGDTISFSREIV